MVDAIRGMYAVDKISAMKSKTEQTEQTEQEQEKEEEDDEDEEALSLCDLPLLKAKEGENESGDQSIGFEEFQEEEFEFGSCGVDSCLKESDMCAAEDVFFQGQILPLRLSVSSESGMHQNGAGQDSRNPSRCGSRSESMDHGFSSSSRSSSIRSGNSNSSSTGCSSTSTSIDKKIGGYRERDLSRNHFHVHPTSPRPQIWPTTAPPGNGGGRSRRSTAWGLFRPGLVRTPEIELHDLKQKVRNRNRNSENSTSNIKKESQKKEMKTMKPTTQKTKVKVFDGFTSGCKCSAIAVEPVPSRVAMKKMGNGSVRVEKQVKEEEGKQLQQEEQQQRQKQGKQAMAHRRTFEWLKQLSLADLQQETLSRVD